MQLFIMAQAITPWYDTSPMVREQLSTALDRLADGAADRLDAFNRSVDPIGTAPTEPSLQREVDALLTDCLFRDFERIKQEFWRNDELVVVEAGLTAEIIRRIRDEIRLESATRSVVPWHRAAGSIGYRRMQREAPFTTAIYRSEVMREYVSALCGKPILCKSDDDDHACTFYVYTKPGDQMAYHYDICGCEDGASYSLIIGVINDCTQRLLIKLHRGTPHEQQLRVSTEPGALITFSGSKLWHGVSPLGRSETRVTLGLAYATNLHQPPKRRLVKVAADTFFHFGVGGWLRKRSIL